MKEFIEHGALKKRPVKPLDKGMLSELLKDHETVMKQLRKYIDESDENIRDKALWFLYRVTDISWNNGLERGSYLS